MRIVGGAWRGLGLAAVGKGDVAASLRPTSDRVRESIFNVLTNGAAGDVVDGAIVLDLFAGTGALGLEALSRGAEFATFVDNGRVARKLIAENISKARANDVARVIGASAERLPAADRPATLVFLDPPYGKGLGERALGAAVQAGWIAEHTVIAWEEAEPMSCPAGFVERDRRRYGGTWVTFLEYGSAET